MILQPGSGSWHRALDASETLPRRNRAREDDHSASAKNPAPAVRDAGKLLLVIGIGASCRRWFRPQAVDQLEDFREHLPRPRNLGHLERNIAAVADDLCADLGHILRQRGERSVLDVLRQGQ